MTTPNPSVSEKKKKKKVTKLEHSVSARTYCTNLQGHSGIQMHLKRFFFFLMSHIAAGNLWRRRQAASSQSWVEGKQEVHWDSSLCLQKKSSPEKSLSRSLFSNQTSFSLSSYKVQRLCWGLSSIQVIVAYNLLRLALIQLRLLPGNKQYWPKHPVPN